MSEAGATGVDDDKVDTEKHPRDDLRRGLSLRGISNRLESDFGDLLTRDTLEHYVEDSYADFAARSRVLTHIPAFVERFARQRLKALAKNRGMIHDHPPEVLFICERNDGASQMAAALFNAQVDGRAHAHSAGAKPAGELLDEAVHALHEVGIEVVGEFPKPITAEIEQAADVIVTLDAHDDIVLLDDKQYQAWRLPDRHDEGIDGYRKLRDELDEHIRELITAVVPPTRAPTHQAFDDDLAELESLLMGMGANAVEMCNRLAAAIASRDPAGFAAVVAADDAIDADDRSIDAKTVEVIARRQPVAGDLRHTLALSNSSLHVERIADGLVDVAIIAGEEQGSIARIGDGLHAMADQVARMTETALRALGERDQQLATQLERLDAELDDLHQANFAALVDARADGTDRPALLRLDRMSRLLKRTGEHAVDIAEQALFMMTGERHELGRHHPTA